jgi:hypothetical protein
MRHKRLRKGLLFAVAGVGACALFGFVVMYLWNWLAPVAFGARTLTFWQALGLLILARILVGGLGGQSGHSSHRRDRMTDRWDQLTPEEREQFRQRLRDRGRRDVPNTEPKAAEE